MQTCDERELARPLQRADNTMDKTDSLVAENKSRLV